MGRGEKPIHTPHAPYVPPPGATMVPIWEIQRRIKGDAAAKAGDDAADANAKQPTPSESPLEL